MFTGEKVEASDSKEKETNVLEHLLSARHLNIKAIQQISLRILQGRLYGSHFTDVRVKLKRC